MSDNIERALGVLIGKVDVIHDSQKTLNEKLESKQEQLTADVIMLKSFKNNSIKIASVVGTGAGAVVSAVWNVVKVKIGS